MEGFKGVDVSLLQPDETYRLISHKIDFIEHRDILKEEIGLDLLITIN